MFNKKKILDKYWSIFKPVYSLQKFPRYGIAKSALWINRSKQKKKEVQLLMFHLTSELFKYLNGNPKQVPVI